MVVVFAFTFIQPPLGVRMFVDVTLYVVLAGIVLARSIEPSRPPISRDRNGEFKLKPSH
jgi:hypothetical protein